MNKSKSGAQIGMGFGFESPVQGAKDEWLTPPKLLEAIGAPELFDLDPCSPIRRPWPTALNHLTIQDNGLISDWGGREKRIFCNPPYGPEAGKWMDKMAQHGNGIALIFARTETKAFQQIFCCASAYLFLEGRLKFHHVDGSQGACATAPSVLIAFDNELSHRRNADILATCGLKGAYFGPATVI